MYANLHCVSLSDVGRILPMATFFRALSGVRDALKWGNEGPDIQQSNRGIEMRLAVLSDCLSIARSSLQDLSQALPISMLQLAELTAFLNELDELYFRIRVENQHV
jgi:hypothetical protein